MGMQKHNPAEVLRSSIVIFTVLSVLMALIASSVIGANPFTDVKIEAKSGSPYLRVNDQAICKVTPETSPLSFRFTKLDTAGNRTDMPGTTNNIFDCVSNCVAGDSLGCTAYASASAPGLSAPCGPVCSLDQYLTCGDGSSAVAAQSSPFVKVLDRVKLCPSIFSTKTVNGASHQLICQKKDPTAENSDIIDKECAGADTPFSAEFSRLGESAIPGETFSLSLGATERPRRFSGEGLLDTRFGSVSISVLPAWDGSDNLAHRFFEFAQDSNNQILLEKRADNKLACEYIASGATTSLEFQVSSWLRGSPHQVAIMWNATSEQMTCFVDGQTGQSRIPNAIPGGATPSGTVTIGGAGDGSNPALAVLDTKMSLVSPTIAYCAQDGTWAFDLDTKGKATCESAKLTWTGSRCCGEAGSKPEYYADPIPLNTQFADVPSTPGACWNSTYLINGMMIPGSDDKILTAAGRFLACAKSDGENAPLADKKDSKTGARIVESAAECTLATNIRGVPENNKYCSPKTGKWTSTTSPEPRVISTSPLDAADKECCPRLSCWDGKNCVGDQSQDSTMQTTGGFRCIGGNWVKITGLTTWNRQSVGSCPRAGECLVNPRGLALKNDMPEEYFGAPNPSLQPACIADGQYIKDYLCDNGNWTTRAKAIALELIQIASTASPDDYAVFCGEYGDVLNFFDYDIGLGSGVVRQYLEKTCEVNGERVPCVNNFCAARYGMRVAFGTSLNIPVGDPDKGFLKAIGKDPALCTSASKTDGRFYPCNNEVRYNFVLESVVVSAPAPIGGAVTGMATRATGKPAGLKPVILREHEPKINEPIKRLTTYVKTSVSNGRDVLTSRLENATLFNGLFILKSAGRDYFGFIEKDVFSSQFVDVAALDYTGIVARDPITGKSACDFIKDRLKPEGLNPLLGESYTCSYDEASKRLIMIASMPSNSATLRPFWRDMTAKIR